MEELPEETNSGAQARGKLYRLIVECNADPIVVVNREGIVELANPAAEQLFHRRAQEMVGEKFPFPITSGDPQELNVAGPGEDLRVAEVRVAKIQLDGKPLHVADLRDMTELVKMREDLRTLSLLDELTGLSNRRKFFTLAQQQMRLANRTKRGMMLLFADLDNLKEINDSLGHQAGDMALMEIANILKDTYRESDIIARIGGDEFVVLALETKVDADEVLRARLQEKLDDWNDQGNRRYQLSVSLGIARYDPENPCTADELLAQADASMYQQKRSRRNSGRGAG